MKIVPVFAVVAGLWGALFPGDTSAAYEEPYGPYAGKIAGKNVVVFFEHERSSEPEDFAAKNPLLGRYFYRAVGKDIELLPVTDGDQEPFIECPAVWDRDRRRCDKPTGYWRVSISSDRLEGTWRQTSDARPEAVSLPRIRPSRQSADLPMQQFDDLRIEGPRQAQKLTTEGQVTWRYVVDRRSGMRSPFLVRTSFPGAMAKINWSLEQNFRNTIRNALWVTSRDKDAFEDENDVWFLNGRYLAVGGASASYQGGTHGLYGFRVTTYDLRTGDAVRFQDLFAFVAEQDRETIRADEDRGILAGIVAGGPVSECWSMALETMSCSADVCGVAVSGMDTTPAWPADGTWPENWWAFPTPQGLAVLTDIWHEAERGCRGDERVIPWARARQALRSPQRWP